MKKQFSKEFLITFLLIFFTGAAFTFGIYTSIFSFSQRIKTLETERIRLENNLNDNINKIYNKSYKYGENHYNPDNTIEFDEFYYNEAKDTNKPRFNYKGEAIFKGKVILNESGKPLTEYNANTDREIITLIKMRGGVPNSDCSEKDIDLIRCWIDD